MRERYTPLTDPEVVFRLAQPGSGHLPVGSVEPLPDWLCPNTADITAANLAQRRPGVSAWQRASASPAEVRVLTGRPEARAFGAAVGVIREVGAPLSVDVVHDPADQFEPGTGWRAHALIEGLQRPAQMARGVHKELRLRLVNEFKALD
jgi:hypothetical protein